METPQFNVILNRQIRRVPLDWEHPGDEYGDHIPLEDRAWLSPETVQELLDEGESPEQIEAAYMPDFSGVPAEELGICVYETTTEGTPISPLLPDTPEGRWALVQHCSRFETVFADQRLSPEGWAELLFGDSLASLDAKTGRVYFHLEPEAA